MNDDASTTEDFFARLGIEPALKAKSLKENIAENAQRVVDAQKLVSRVDAIAIKTTAKAFRI